MRIFGALLSALSFFREPLPPRYPPNAMSNATIYNGSMVINSEYVNDLLVNGNLNINKSDKPVSLKGFLRVNGEVNLNHASFVRHVNFNGRGKILNSVFKESCVLNGRFNAQDTVFQDLDIYGTVELSKCIAQNIFLAATGNFFRDKFIVRASVIKGNVTFESGKGRLILKDGSKIEGNIIGGTKE